MSNPIKIATFNTYWLYDNEAPLRRWGERLPEGGLSEKIRRMTGPLLELSADVLALQEVEGPEVLEALRDALKAEGLDYPHIYCSETLDPFTGQNVAVLSRFRHTTSPVTRLDQTTEPYVDQHQRLRTGSLGKFLRVDVEVPGPDGDTLPEILTLFVTHLKSRRGDGPQATRYQRDAQAQIMRRYAMPRVEQGTRRSPSFVAIMGDFNDEPDTTPLRIMRGLRDPGYDLFTATEDLSPDQAHTYVFKGKKQQLDHILLNLFCHERKLDAGVQQVDIDKDSNGFVSDHHIVWTTLDLHGEPPAPA